MTSFTRADIVRGAFALLFVLFSLALPATAVAQIVAQIGAQAGAQACDRTCLVQTLDRFLAGIIAHDPAAAGLAPNFRYTENALEVARGQVLWKSATKLGALQRRYVDAVTGQAAYFGLIEEGTEQALRPSASRSPAGR